MSKSWSIAFLYMFKYALNHKKNYEIKDFQEFEEKTLKNGH